MKKSQTQETEKLTSKLFKNSEFQSKKAKVL